MIEWSPPQSTRWTLTLVIDIDKKGGDRRSFINPRRFRDRPPRPHHKGAAVHTQPVVRQWRGHNGLVNPNGEAWRNEYLGFELATNGIKLYDVAN